MVRRDQTCAMRVVMQVTRPAVSRAWLTALSRPPSTRVCLPSTRVSVGGAKGDALRVLCRSCGRGACHPSWRAPVCTPVAQTRHALQAAAPVFHEQVVAITATARTHVAVPPSPLCACPDTWYLILASPHHPTLSVLQASSPTLAAWGHGMWPCSSPWSRWEGREVCVGVLHRVALGLAGIKSGHIVGCRVRARAGWNR